MHPVTTSARWSRCWFVAVWVAGVSEAAAQCATQWLPGEGVPGVAGSVYAVTTWDPDGPGPATPVLVFGGQFSAAGSEVGYPHINNVVVFDPARGTWSRLGAGSGGDNGTVYALAVLPDGDLVAGGTAGIARWNGSSWSALGTGPNGYVRALLTLPNGDLIAGGEFTFAGGVQCNSIARWNGSSWSAFGTGMATGSARVPTVYALATFANGDIVAGGIFAAAGGVGANYIARWNGSSWSPLGSGMSGAGTTRATGVLALVRLADDSLVAGGVFTTAGGVGANNIAHWNGTSWSPLGSGISASDPFVSAIATRSGSDIVAGGWFMTAGGVSANGVARWDGSSWSPLATSSNAVYSLCELPGGDLVAGGSFATMGGVLADSVARWNGTSWSAFGTGMNGVVVALATLPDGSFVACSSNTVARRSGGSWSLLGSANGEVSAVTCLPNGDIVVGGYMTAIAGIPVNHVARWNGTSWSPMGSGLDGLVMALLTLPNGDVVAGGNFSTAGGTWVQHIARWDGSTWSPMASGTGSIWVQSLARLLNGDLVAMTDNGIMRWNGSSWSPLGAVGGSQPFNVGALTTLPDGDIVAARGDFIGRWNGSAWIPLGPVGGLVYALATLPDGDLVAGGWFLAVGGVSANFLARWNGTTWSALSTGANDSVYALTALPDGDLVAGGRFLGTPGNVSAYVARLTTTCPAVVAAFGSSCNGPSGPVALTANSLPWTGSAFRATATGLSPTALAFSLVGYSSPNVPLSLIHPAGISGCDLLASTDLVLFLVPTAGTAVSEFLLPPNGPVFAGTILKNQVLQLELGPQFSLVSISSSNGLSLTVGTF